MALKKSPNSLNVRGQAISVRHYLEVRLKSRPYFYNGQEQESYPLYVQIDVKKQTSQRRSMLDAYVSRERFDQYLRDHAQAIEIETKTLLERVKAAKPFDNQNFKLKYALDGNTALQEDVCYHLGGLLRYDYQNALVGDLVDRMRADLTVSLPGLQAGQIAADDIEEQTAELTRQARFIVNRGKVGPGATIHPRIVFGEVMANALPDNERVVALRDRYGVYFWALERYCAVLRLQLQQPAITLEFFLTPAFKSLFLRYWDEDIYLSINQGFDLLKQDKLELAKLVGA